MKEGQALLTGAEAKCQVVLKPVRCCSSTWKRFSVTDPILVVQNKDGGAINNEILWIMTAPVLQLDCLNFFIRGVDALSSDTFQLA